MLRASALLVLLLAIVAYGDYCGPWVAIDLKNYPFSHSDDKINVYFLAAPLMYCSLKDELSYLHGYHGGIGFKNMNTGQALTFNYNAASFSEAVFPKITYWPDGNVTLEWNESGDVYVYEGINLTYWHSEQTLVATMTGAQYNTFLRSMYTANDTYTEYNTISVYQSYPDKVWLPPYECFEFVFDIIYELQRLGGVLTPGLTKLHASICSLYSNHMPAKVQFADPKFHQDIIDYYEMLERNFKKLGVIGFIKQVWKLLIQGNAYVYYSGEYYHAKLTFPYIAQHWRALPIPIYNATVPRPLRWLVPPS